MSEGARRAAEVRIFNSDLRFPSSFGIGHSSFISSFRPPRIICHLSHRTCHRSEQVLTLGKSGNNAFSRQNLFPSLHRLRERSVPRLGRDCLAPCRPAIHPAPPRAAFGFLLL